MFLEEITDKGALFLRMWAGIKEEKTGKKTRIKKLGEKEERLLRKHLKSGYTLKDFEEATTALFNDPGGYAMKNGLDVPLHLLRNFVTYLEKYESTKEKKRADEKKQDDSGGFLGRDEWAAACWEVYRKSLNVGEWLGTVAHSIEIAKKLAESIPGEVKTEIYTEAKKEREELISKKSEFVTAMQIADFNIRTDVNIYADKIVRESVKRKVNPWKQ